MRADGEGDDYVVIDHEQDTVTIGHPKVEDLMAVPDDACRFVAAERGMSSIGTEHGELGAGNVLDIERKGFELAFEPDGAPEDHRSLTMSARESYCWGSTASSICSLVSARSLGVGLRAGTVAANNTGSKGTSTFVLFVLAFTAGQPSRKAAQLQRQKPPGAQAGRTLSFSERGHSCPLGGRKQPSGQECPMPLGIEARSHACQRHFGCSADKWHNYR